MFREFLIHSWSGWYKSSSRFLHPTANVRTTVQPRLPWKVSNNMKMQPRSVGWYEGQGLHKLAQPLKISLTFPHIWGAFWRVSCLFMIRPLQPRAQKAACRKFSGTLLSQEAPNMYPILSLKLLWGVWSSLWLFLADRRGTEGRLWNLWRIHVEEPQEK